MRIKPKKIFQGLTFFLFSIVMIQLIATAFAAGNLLWTPLINGVTVSDVGQTGSPATPVEQQNSQVIKAHDGNYITVWEDGRSGNKNIYAQKLQAADGASLWTAGGVAVVSAAGDQTLSENFTEVISDNADGAIIAWNDNRSGSSALYVQRLNGNGSPLWTSDGIPIDNSSTDPVMVEDGTGGVYLAWVSNAAGTADILVTHLNSNGIVSAGWNTIGEIFFRPLHIANDAIFQEIDPQLVLDSNGDLLISYFYVDGVNNTLAAAKFDADGNILWQNKTIIQNIGSTNHQQHSISDGAGGLITSFRSTTGGENVSVQKLGNDGSQQWGSTGKVVININSGTIGKVAMIDDRFLPVHGAILTWEDDHTSSGEVYTQRIDSNGDIQWDPAGVAVSSLTDGNEASSPVMVSNGGYGTVIIYMSNNHIFAQHFNNSGVPQWSTPGGEQIETASWNEVLNAAASDGNGGVVITWAGSPSGPTHDLYAQYISDTVGGLCAEGGSQNFCGQQQITQAILTFQAIPASFSFGSIMAGTNQDVFNNNSTDDPPSISSAEPDLLKVYDNRNNGGFVVDISVAGTFTDGIHTIPLNDLYIVTTLDETNLNNGNPANGEQAGVTYGGSIPGGNSGTRTVSAPAYVNINTNHVDDKRSYLLNSSNTQFGAAPLILMDGTLSSIQGRNGTMSQLVSFYLHIGATQLPGQYTVTLTYTLTDSTI